MEVMKKFVLGISCILLVVIIFWGLWLPGKYVVPVLMYHSIGDAASDRAKANTVSLRSFDEQMAYIRKNGYKVLALDEYMKVPRSGRGAPDKGVVITFDDGLANNYKNAFPILKKYNIPSAIFIPLAYIGQSDSPMGLPMLTWPQIKEMAANGVTIGSHTVQHFYLPELGLEAVHRELVESKAGLEAGLGRAVKYLAYPIGGFSDDIKQIVQAAGYKAAFTTNRGYDRLNHDLYQLRRIRIKDTDGPIELWVKLSGYYNLFRRDKKSF